MTVIPRWRSLATYGAAVVFVLLAAIARGMLQPVFGGFPPLLPFTLAVAAAAGFGGVGPGLLATLLSLLCGAFGMFASPISAAINTVSVRYTMALFALVSVGITFLVDRVRRQSRDLLQRQQELDATHARLRLLTESAPVMIAELDMQERFRFANQLYAELFGTTATEIIGRHRREVSGEERYAQSRAPLNAVLSGQSASFELQFSPTRTLFVTYTPEIASDGTQFGFVASLIDMTELKRTQSALASSEARFGKALNVSPVGFILLSAIRNPAHTVTDFACTYINEVAERVIGKSSKRLLGEPVGKVLPDVWEIDGLFAQLESTMQTGRTHEMEVQGRATAVHGTFYLVSAPFDDGVMLWFLDITDRKTTEAALRERERRFSALADAMPQLVWVSDPVGHAVYLNRGWLEYTGLSAKELTSETGWEVCLHPDDLLRTRAHWQSCIGSGTPYEIDLRLRRHDGTYRWFLARATLDRDSDGTTLRWLGTCTDIDEAKRMQATLISADAALREADERKDVFIATLAHELRNPLAAIRMAAQTLGVRTLDSEAADKSRQIVTRQVRHMSRLLDDLLDISRITRGAVVLKRESVAVADLVDAAVETAQPLVSARHHRLEVDLPPHLPRLHVDPVRVTQVIANLISNSAKYTDPGGTIQLNARPDGDGVLLSVADTGIGISPQMLPRLFEMFAQEPSAVTRSEGGLGIGLALVRGLVQLHGGHVTVQSEGPGRGSEFRIWLPCGTPVPNTDNLAATPNATAALYRPVGGSGVLIADDNRDAAFLAADWLRRAGHDVHLAHDGAQALQMARSLRPKFVLLDIGMPEMSGYEVAESVRRESWSDQTTIIAITGWGQSEDVERARQAGFDLHITKPVDPDVLQRLLASAEVSPDDQAR